MWVEIVGTSEPTLMNMDTVGIVIRETPRRLSFRYKNREGYRDFTFDTKELCESEFNRIKGLLLQMKSAKTVSSEG